MTDFVLEQTELLYEKNQSKLIHRVVNYAQFLKQPLTLGMFVPCDEEGNILEEPIISEHLLDRPGGSPIKSKNTPEAYYYRKAKERVLFEGFEVKKDICYKGEKRISVDYAIYIPTMRTLTIEELISKKKTPLTLTETAIKQIGL